MTESLPVLAAEATSKNMLVWLGVAFAALLIFLFITALIIKQYKRCPSNRLLVVYGKTGAGGAGRKPKVKGVSTCAAETSSMRSSALMRLCA